MGFSPTGVHPVADLFPMMTDDELADLAADIKANGLIHPIVIDKDGLLIDGRNRLAACDVAGIEPVYTTLNGHDPVAFIIGANVIRRQLSKGQAAMAVARSREFQKLKITDAAASVGVSVGRVGQASTVLTYAPDLADAVMSGATSLDDAYTEARTRKVAASSAESQMAWLKLGAPDLVTMVIEGRLTLAGALAEMESRKRKAMEARRGATTWVSRVLDLLDPPAAYTPEESAAETFERFDPSTVSASIDVSLPRLRRCQAVLTVLVGLFEERKS